MSLKRQGFFATLVDSQSGHFIRLNLSPADPVRKLRGNARTSLRKLAAFHRDRAGPEKWGTDASRVSSNQWSTVRCAVAPVSETVRLPWRSTSGTTRSAWPNRAHENLQHCREIVVAANPCDRALAKLRFHYLYTPSVLRAHPASYTAA